MELYIGLFDSLCNLASLDQQAGVVTVTQSLFKEKIRSV